jgi:hypothetical protein
VTGNPYASPQLGNRRNTYTPGPTTPWSGNGRYAVPQIPDTTDPEYTTAFSPKLKPGGSPDGSQLPDDIRIGTREPIVGENYNEPGWQARRNSDRLFRHAEEQQRGMWRVRQDRVPAPRMPIWEQERRPTRPTASCSPLGYLKVIPKHIPRNAAEALGPDAVLHFSLADHRRLYAISTQKPQGRVGVNSYRASPRPWDENLFIPPPAGGVATQQPSRISGNRAFRA